MSIHDVALQEVLILAEDVYRLAPWDRLPDNQLYLFVPEEDPDAWVSVYFSKDAPASCIYFNLATSGLRSQLDFMTLEGAERMVAEYDRHAYVVQFDEDNHSSQANSELDIGIFLVSPGEPWRFVEDEQSLTYISRFLSSLRQIFHQGQPVIGGSYVIDEKHDQLSSLLTVPQWHVGLKTLTYDGLVSFNPFEVYDMSSSQLDEFTLERLKRLPPSLNDYELYFFYLRILSAEHDQMFPRVYFLVNLESGEIEWTHVISKKKNSETLLLREIFNHFFKIGRRPNVIFISNDRLYERVAVTFEEAAIDVEPITMSYVADELMTAYPFLNKTT